ncbi:MAG: GDP-mannose 4,6-dehydratase [Candidatus Micrarchaeia archaeon]|jgi:GDPmannose 4,6-dehydratase
MKKSLIFGVSGQDGYYLGRLLLAKGHDVVGASRAPACPACDFAYAQCDVSKKDEVARLVSKTLPGEIYNLAGASSPSAIEKDPGRSYEINVKGAANIISAAEAICPSPRVFQASSGYIFSEGPGLKSESSRFGPTSVYGRQKLEAHSMVADARKSGLFAANGILFNHESPLRGTEFVTRKVTKAAAEFKLKLRSSPLRLGSLDSVRDWGFAGDYVDAMRLMLGAGKPKDYVISTGIGHTVSDLCKAAFDRVGLDYEKHVSADSSPVPQTGPSVLIGDPSLIRKDLKWSAKTSFEELVKMMVDYDLSAGA